MKIEELKDRLPQEIIESAAKRGISKLTPPQELAIEYGLLSGKNFVIASPTASGKTFVAELSMLKSVIWDRKKAIYIAPMRALVSEKFSDFKEAYPFLKVAMSIGDLDALDHWLATYDIIFVSTEKLDSLIRHGADWLNGVGCVVFDEIHMLDDSGRGPTLEILITKLRRMCRDAQLISLSATIGNTKELAEWLDAELVESDYRPVKLDKGIELNGKVFYDGQENQLTGKSRIPEICIAEDTMNLGKQILVFYATKRNAESGADKLSNMINERLTLKEKMRLKELSEQVGSVLSKPTTQCEKLAKAVAKGVAFHHSGLVNEQRHLIEEAFKNNELKALCSTTTLCLPADEEVMCNFEPKSISSLNNFEKVLSHSGNFKKVIGPSERYYEGELVKVYPFNQLPMRMTPEHRVLRVKRKRHINHYYTKKTGHRHKFWYEYSQPEWLEAGELRKGDLVLFPRVKKIKDIKSVKLGNNGLLINQTGVVGKHWTKLKVNELTLDNEMLEIMGLFIAEGSTGLNGVIKFDVNTKEVELTNKISSWFSSVGVKTKIIDKERNRRSVVGCSKQISKIFREIFGHNAKMKIIPHKFIYLPKDKLIALVRGMWLGDGSIYLKKTYGDAEYSTVSKVLAKQLFTILVRLGYMPRIKYTKSKETIQKSFYKVNIPKHGDIYRISIAGKQLVRFAKEILNKDLVFNGNRTYNMSKIDEDYYYMPIRKIKNESFTGKVYNLEVEGDSSYVGSFIVHNSLGINMPAHTVLVRDTVRYEEGGGSQKMSVNVVSQLFGRAGRPKYDTKGRALLIARSESEVRELYDRYINAEYEPIESKLGLRPILRTHILAFIATRFLTSEESILDFLNGTFYGYQYSNMREIKNITKQILDELIEWNFLQKTGSTYAATRIGERVSELYIDPMSAKWIIDTLPKLTDEISHLFMICNTLEMRPYMRATEEAAEHFMQYTNMLGGSVNFESDGFTYYDPLKPFSTAMMLYNWIGEKSEQEIVKAYSTTPGALFAKSTNADWLLYSAMELAKLTRQNTIKILETRIRVRYGIKKELLDLIRLEGIGRVRARVMYDSGIKGIGDLRKEESRERLKKLFGEAISTKIYEQLNNF